MTSLITKNLHSESQGIFHADQLCDGNEKEFQDHEETTNLNYVRAENSNDALQEETNLIQKFRLSNDTQSSGRKERLQRSQP